MQMMRWGMAVGMVMVMLGMHSSTNVQAQPGKKGIIAPKSLNAEVKLGTAEVKMEATAWFPEFKEKFDESRKKYEGKVIELTGTVLSVGEDYGNARIRLKGDDKNGGFNCYTVDRRPWLKVVPGATIKVKGIVPASGSAGDLGSVQIVSAGQYNAVALTAVQLASEYAKDRKEAISKYHDKWCNLTGEVIETKDAPNGYQVKLKTGNDINVICVSGTFGKNDPIQTLKKGTKAKLFGQLIVTDSSDKSVYLTTGLLSEPRK